MNAAFLSYAIGHGLQYFVFMGVMVGRAGDGGQRPWRMWAGAAALFSVLAPLLVYVGPQTLQGRPIGDALGLGAGSDFLFGCYLGIVMAHFWVDRYAWRMSRPLERAAVMRRFGPVLAAAHGAPVAAHRAT
jgi:hypothetical protein